MNKEYDQMAVSDIATFDPEMFRFLIGVLNGS
jgi:hypothetical protein